MTQWWKRPQRIVQTNLRLTDASLDPEHVAEELAAFGATAMLFNVGGIFAWYPSELSLQAANPFLDRDLLGAMIRAAHDRDIKVIGRYDLSKGTRAAYDAQPDWFCCGPDGAPFEYNGTYQACVNGEWYRQQAPALLKETLGRYEIDGLFFNMFGYLGTDYSYAPYSLCHCINCRRRYESYGGALPLSRDLADPNYRRYLRFQEETSQELAEEIRTLVKSVRPDVAVSNMGRHSDFFRGEVNRRLDRPRPEWAHWSGEQARRFRSLGRNRIRYSSALTHFVDFPWRYAAESADAQVLRIAQQLAGGADPHYYFMGTTEQADRQPLKAMRDVFAFHARNEERYRELESCARIAVYASLRAPRYLGDAQTSAFRGTFRALVESGIDFDLVHPDRTRDDDFAASHLRYDAIFLSGADALSQEEADALDTYVEAGGSLIALAEAGAYDDTGDRREASALQCMPCRSAGTPFDSRGAYLVLDNCSAGEETDLLLLDGPVWPVEPKPGAETRYRVLMPQRFGPPELCYPDDPTPSDHPGLVIGRHGSGRCVYLPWRADLLFHEHGLPGHRSLIRHLAREFSSPPEVELRNAPRIELTVQRQQGTGTRLVHLVNYSGQSDNTYQPPVPLSGAELLLRGAGPFTCRALVADRDLEASVAECGSANRIALPEVTGFEVIQIDG